MLNPFPFFVKLIPRREQSSARSAHKRTDLHCELAVAGVWVSPRKTNIGARWTGIVHTLDRGYRSRILFLGGTVAGGGKWDNSTTNSPPFFLVSGSRNHPRTPTARERLTRTVLLTWRQGTRKSALDHLQSNLRKGQSYRFFLRGSEGRKVFANPRYLSRKHTNGCGSPFPTLSQGHRSCRTASAQETPDSTVRSLNKEDLSAR
ncbi:hypothetical protein SCHPADRAFT_906922 [Schizopora paradoxa]|uniref:Uncharacterized protein n=1 Tax=Schizopora paradoxa TaxID=27342 RepID=A0A0H2S0A4_9AGAM|nr:hypothetical protein SCHPADRAFT_906922 [Schizopora paradoxa]